MNLEARILSVVRTGRPMTAREIAHKLDTDFFYTRDAVRRLRHHNRLESRLRENGKAEYWTPKGRSFWIVRPWLRRTGMKITKDYREDRGDYSR